jgi:IS5 family transposase
MATPENVRNCMQHWFAMEGVRNRSMRLFARLSWIDLPDRTTIMNFRQLRAASTSIHIAGWPKQAS